MFVALAGSMALRCHHNNLLPAAHGAGGHSARLQLWARGQDVLGLSCLPPCTQGRAAAHQFSLLMWSPKPGVSMTVSFMRTPFSSISEREESWCVRRVLMGALAKPTLPRPAEELELAPRGEMHLHSSSHAQIHPPKGSSPISTLKCHPHSHLTGSFQQNKLNADE